MTKKKKIALGFIIFGVIVVLAGTAWLSAYYFYRPDYLKSDKVFDVSKTDIDAEITIMSYNVRYLSATDCGKKSWFYRADLVLDIIKTHEPDLIGFQEVTTTHEEYIKQHLKGYTLVFVYRDASLAKETAMIAFRTDRFDLEEQGHFWLSLTPEVQSKNWNSERYRDANYVYLREKQSGKQIAFFNTHLDSKSALAREYGVEVLIERMLSADRTTFVTGDFNDKEDSPMYEKMISAGFYDNGKIDGADWGNIPTTYNGFSDTERQRIDFCFSKGATATSYKVDQTLIDGVYPSDHFPIITTFSLT